MDKDDLKSLLKEVLLEMKEEEAVEAPKKKKVVRKKAVKKKTVKKVDPDSLPALKARAKEAGIKGYYHMRKADLKAVLDRGKNNLPSMLAGIDDLSDKEKEQLNMATELDKVSKPSIRFGGNRPPAVKVDVECRVCKKKDSIPQSMVPFNTAEDRQEGWNSYCCNRCIGRG